MAGSEKGGTKKAKRERTCPSAGASKQSEAESGSTPQLLCRHAGNSQPKVRSPSLVGGSSFDLACDTPPSARSSSNTQAANRRATQETRRERKEEERVGGRESVARSQDVRAESARAQDAVDGILPQQPRNLFSIGTPGATPVVEVTAAPLVGSATTVSVGRPGQEPLLEVDITRCKEYIKTSLGFLTRQVQEGVLDRMLLSSMVRRARDWFKDQELAAPTWRQARDIVVDAFKPSEDDIQQLSSLAEDHPTHSAWDQAHIASEVEWPMWDGIYHICRKFLFCRAVTIFFSSIMHFVVLPYISGSWLDPLACWLPWLQHSTEPGNLLHKSMSKMFSGDVIDFGLRTCFDWWHPMMTHMLTVGASTVVSMGLSQKILYPERKNGRV